jgi:hypothetical protein
MTSVPKDTLALDHEDELGAGTGRDRVAGADLVAALRRPAVDPHVAAHAVDALLDAAEGERVAYDKKYCSSF